MKNNNKYILFLILGLMSSCMTFEEKPSKQQYVDYQIGQVKKIVVTDYDAEMEKSITEGNGISEFSRFLSDSTNYFKGDLIKSSGQRSTHRLDLIRTRDTLTLILYPTSEPDKVEVGFFDPEELKNHDQYKEFKRFYIHRSILELVNFMPD